MMHLIYYLPTGNTATVCGFEEMLPTHSSVHIAWASDTLLQNENVCIMCHTEWYGAVDNLERSVRDE